MLEKENIYALPFLASLELHMTLTDNFQSKKEYKLSSGQWTTSDKELVGWEENSPRHPLATCPPELISLLPAVEDKI